MTSSTLVIQIQHQRKCCTSNKHMRGITRVNKQSATDHRCNY